MAGQRIGWRAYVASGGGVDTDAQAFITAAAITNTTQQNAINTLVTDFKGYGIWSKMKALYPFVGGTAAQHRFNLKDPRTINDAFYLDFIGGWTHTSTGALPNGTTGYANTKFTISQVYPSSITNIHVSYYSRTNSYNYYMIGVADQVGAASGVYVQDNRTRQYYSALNDSAGGITVVKSQSSIGHYLTSRTSLTSLKGYINGVVQGSNTSTQSPLKSTIPIVLGGYSSRSVGYPIWYYYGNKESAFASIGDGLTDTEAVNFYTSVQKFNTTLGRQIGTPIV